MPGDTVFRRFAALPRAIVAHLIAAEPLYRSVFLPRQTWFRSYQRCCQVQSPWAADPSPPHKPGVASLVAAKPGSAGL